MSGSSSRVLAEIAAWSRSLVIAQQYQQWDEVLEKENSVRHPRPPQFDYALAIDGGSRRQANRPARFDRLGVEPIKAAGIVVRLGFA
jgi:hypothetical protein